MANKKLGNIFKEIFSSVESDTIAKLNEGDRVEEDHITSTVLTLLEERVKEHTFSGLFVRARQFQGRGPNSDESITGADGALILDVKLKDTEFRKFYIFQAKNFKYKNTKFDERALDQKHRMLSWTPASFFLIYTPRNFCFISAFLVGLNNRVNKLPSKRFIEFHKDFFNCFIGDHFLRFLFFPFCIPRRRSRFGPELGPSSKFIEKRPIAKRNIQIDISQSE